MTVDDLKASIFRKYVKAFEDINRIKEKEKMIMETVYATRLCYDIEKYEYHQLLPDGDLSTARPESNPYTYGLDQQGWPCYFQWEHTWNQEFWEGFYEFSNDEIYLVAYNRKEQKPVVIHRLLLENGKKTGFQLLQVNGHKLGKSYENLSSQEIADKLQADENDLLCRIEQYFYDGDRICEASGWCTFPGLGAQSYQQFYQYGADGGLEEIKCIYSDNRTQYLYVKPPASLTIEALSDQLAREMAEQIAANLDPKMFSAPLAIMQLYYQEIGNYDPYITALTVDT